MTGPLTAVKDSKGNRVYKWPDGKGGVIDLISVSTIVRCLPAEKLIGWAAREAANAAVDRYEDWKDLSEADAKAWLASRYEETRDTAGNRGTNIHNAIADRLTTGFVRPITEKNAWWEEGNSNYVDAAFDFMDKHFLKPTIPGVEVELAHPSLGYSGTADLVCRDALGVRWLIDWKTGSRIYPKDGLQLLAYSRATERLAVEDGRLVGKPVRFTEEPQLEMRIVHLRSDRTWRAYKPIETDLAWNTFRALIQVKRWEMAVGSRIGDGFAGSIGSSGR